MLGLNYKMNTFSSLCRRNVEFNAVASGILFFSAYQQQAELSGDAGSNYQSPEHYCENSEWGTGSVSTMQDQVGSGHHLFSLGDDYGNSEKLGAGDTSGQQPFSYWNVSASHAEVREFFLYFMCLFSVHYVSMKGYD
jgi:hypothetical protein